MKTRSVRRDRVKTRRASAKERQAAHDALTPAEKIAKLDAKLGVNVGACSERKRLMLLLAVKAKLGEGKK